MIARHFGLDLAGRKDPRMLLGLLWGSGAALFEVLPYMIVAWVFSALVSGAYEWSLPSIAGLLLVCFFGAWWCKAYSLYDSFAATYGLVADMRLIAANHLSQVSLGAVSQHRQAALADLFTDRFSLYQDIVTHLWWQLSTTVGIPLLLWLLLLAVNWPMAITMAAFVPAAVLLIPWSFRLLEHASAKVIPARDDLASRVVEVVEGMKEILLLDPARSRLSSAHQAVDELERMSILIETAPAPATLSFGFVWSVGFTVSIFVGSIAWSLGGLSALSFALGMVVAARLFATLQEIGGFLVEYRFAIRALDAIRAFMHEPALTIREPTAVPQSALVELRGVNFSHSETSSLRDIDLILPAGTLTAIVGPSGAGKTTLVSLLGRLWDVNAGQVCIGGVDIREMSPDTLNSTVSMVLQDVSLFELSVLENIRLGKPDAGRKEVEEAARAARIHERIRLLPDGYDTILAGSGSALSGGERQRLAIARAILKNAPVLVLDEATASIDLDNERLIQEALENLTIGKTVILIAHRLWTVTQADKIVILDNGSIVATGRHEDLLTSSKAYSELWQSH